VIRIDAASVKATNACEAVRIQGVAEMVEVMPGRNGATG